MPSLAATADGPGRLSRLGRLIVDSTVGTLLCTGPVTAVIALGWLTRRQSHLARARFGHHAHDPASSAEGALQ